MKSDYKSVYRISTIMTQNQVADTQFNNIQVSSTSLPIYTHFNSDNTLYPGTADFEKKNGMHGVNHQITSANIQPAKRKYNEGPGKICEISAINKTPTILGKDDSYPPKLNELIDPLKCNLCKTKMNSLRSAKDHYESKIHDRNISNWLTKNYLEKGLQPPEVKRFFKKGPAGPDAFHCEDCDLKLTSLTHANQHYAGRKHILVVNNLTKPSGTGYYNKDKKWIRTGHKMMPTTPNNNRFGIGESFQSVSTTTVPNKIDPDTSKTVLEVSKQTVTSNESHFCEICNVNVTSAGQLVQHLAGIKHQKKVNANNANAAFQNNLPSTSNSILSSLNNHSETDIDYSMYRTPSGSYYCKICNSIMCNIAAIKQHLEGKKHIKKSAEENK